MSKIIKLQSSVRVHVPDSITQEQIQAIVHNLASECGPTFSVQDQAETHLMDVASAEDINIINTVDIADVDVWVDDVYDIEYLNDE